MLSEHVKPKNGASSVSGVVDILFNGDLPVKSLAVITDVFGGEIFGGTDDTDHEMELAAGVSYIVIGLGNLETSYNRGITYVDAPKENTHE